jgi:hypothetical protein
MTVLFRLILATLFTGTVGLVAFPTAAASNVSTKSVPVEKVHSTAVSSLRAEDPMIPIPVSVPTAPEVVVSPSTTQPPVTVPVTVPVAPVVVSAPVTDNSAIFECIIRHESGGDPHAINPSSYAGGLFQFLPSSWAAYGGTRFAPTADQATADQQWQIAIAAQAQSGWYPWVGTNCTPVG